MTYCFRAGRGRRGGWVGAEMPLLDLSQGFAYRGEGNANLVVALPKSRIILRFPKSKYNEKSQCEKLEAICRYINLVMRPELPQYVDPVTIGMLDWAQFQLVRERVEPSRPASRLGKGIFYPAALVMPDCALRPPPGSSPSAPLLAVEIKPKLGLMSGSGLCKFCLKQYYKLQTKEVAERSQYCPLDLFSGDPARMLRATKALLAAPQNNLRLLLDGVLLPCGQDPGADATQEMVASLLGSQDALAPLLVSCLSHQPNQVASLQPVSPILASKAGKRRCSLSTGRSLPTGCILDTIQKLQGRSPLSDREALEQLESLLEKGEELGQLQEEMTKPCGPAGDRLQPLKDYLLSVTARDLSLILTLAEAATSERPPPMVDCIRVKERWICFRWSVIDLDPKSLNRIPKNVEQQKLWMEAFLRNSNL